MDQTLLLHWDRYLWSTSPMMRGSLFRTSSRRGGLINPKGQLVLIVKSSQSADLGSIWGDVLEVWDAACLRLEYYWMQVASLSRNVDGLAFFTSFYQASCDPCHLQLACHGSGTIGLFSWTGLCEAELAPTSCASLGLFELHSEAKSWSDLGYFKLGEIYSYHQQMIRVQNEIPRRGPYLPGWNIRY